MIQNVRGKGYISTAIEMHIQHKIKTNTKQKSVKERFNEPLKPMHYLPMIMVI
jgi:hypothetical protein